MTWIRSQWQWHIVDPYGEVVDGWPEVLCLDFEPPENGVRVVTDVAPPEDERCASCVRESSPPPAVGLERTRLRLALDRMEAAAILDEIEPGDRDLIVRETRALLDEIEGWR